MRYILIDIDGTMTAGGEGGGAGSVALNLAFEELFGRRNAFDGVRKAGKTDPIILREGFAANGVAFTEELGAHFKERYLHHLREQIAVPRRRAKVLPGVINLLDALRNRPTDAAMGLLTGNWLAGARIKLGSVMLDSYFDDERSPHGASDGAFALGAFGEDAPTRPALVPVAWRRFRTAHGRDIAPEATVIIGDTPRDVECARLNGVPALAVATGPFGMDELAKSRAELVLPDLSDTKTVLDFLLR